MLKLAARIVFCIVFCQPWPERAGKRSSLMRMALAFPEHLENGQHGTIWVSR